MIDERLTEDIILAVWKAFPRPQRICVVPGCQRKHYAKGFCNTHYLRDRKGQPLLPPIKSSAQKRAESPICTVEGCERTHYGKGFCQTHWARFHRYGDPLASKPICRTRPIRHGTVNAYKNRGCRCDLCREAHRLYFVERRRSKGVMTRQEVAETQKRHGVARYRKGCRCDICRTASLEAKRRWRELRASPSDA